MIERFKDFSDNTIKTVNKLDKGVVEMSLLLNKKDMDVICAPTHYYCNLGCKMCHLTKDGLNKPMIKINIKEFLYTLVKSVNNNLGFRRTKNKKLLISFMGVGEPLLNLELIEDVIKNEKYIKERLGYTDIGYAIRTMMPNNNLLKLIDIVNKYNVSLKVHFSMHNPIDLKRKELIPSTRVNVETALKYLDKYRKEINNDKFNIFHRSNDKVEIHYTLIKDVNDSDMELNELLRLLDKYKITIKFIKFNEKDKLKISKNEEKWINALKSIDGLRVKTYSPPGKEVGSSCGEFTKHYYHEDIETKKKKKEFLNWKMLHQIFD